MKRTYIILLGLMLLLPLQGQVIRANPFYVSSAATEPPPGGDNDLLTNLVAYWTLDETTGLPQDSEGIHHVATNTGVTLNQAGILGRAVLIEHVNSDVLVVTGGAELQMYNSDFSFSAWVYMNSYLGAATRHGIIGGEGSSAHLNIRGIDVNSYYLQVAGDNEGGEGTNTFGVNGWHHVVVTYSDASATNNIHYYIDGVGEIVSGDINVLSGATSIWLGARNDGYDTVFSMDGLLDEVGVWKGRILSQGDVDYLFNSGTGTSFNDFE